MHPLGRFGIDDLVTCSAAFKEVTQGATTMETAVQAIVSYLHDNLVDDAGDPACALIRFYKTHRFDRLEPSLQKFALDAAGGVADDVEPTTPCLTLLATRGREPEWNDRTLSQGHRAIPLVSAEVVERSPMIASLLAQLGVTVASIVKPDERRSIELHHQDYDVFFVADAVGDPMVPAQEEFVVPYGIHSVIGCGGVLPSGELFALLLFTTVHISVNTAELFRTLALSIKASIVPLTFEVFAAR